MNKKAVYLVFIFILYLFLLKDYFNLILATIVFAYFTEVFIDVFSKLREKVINLWDKNFENDKIKKNQLITLFIGFFRKLRINVLFVYIFYLFFIIFLVLFIFIPVINNVKNVLSIGVSKFPLVLENLKNLLVKYNIPVDISKNPVDIGKVVDFVLNYLIKLMGNLASNLGDWFILILVPLLSMYFISAKKQFLGWIKERELGLLSHFFIQFDRYQKVYVMAILTNILSIVVLSSIVFSLVLGIEGISFGVVYGLFSFIPLVGPVVGSLPVIIVSFSQSLFLGFGMIFVVFIIQQISDNFIMPKTVEKFLTINPFLSIISILGFYKFLGFWAVFLAVPLALTLISLIEKFNQQSE